MVSINEAKYNVVFKFSYWLLLSKTRQKQGEGLAYFALISVCSIFTKDLLELH